MLNKIFNDRTPGWIAKTLLIVITSFWCYWSLGEMYHEGWWGPFYHPLIYLIPGAGFLLLTLIGIQGPRLGGWLIIVLGGAFAIFFLNIHFVDGKIAVNRDLAGVLISAPVVLLGALLLIEARNHKKRVAEGWKPSTRWGRRNLWTLLAVTPPLLIMVGMSIMELPVVLTRQDDGERGMRTIEGNGVTLVWAPEGPGWNWKQDYGGYPSWNSIALYGLEPVGLGDKPGFDVDAGEFASAEEMAQYNLCLYLSEDGLTLENEPQNIWRMPTVDDYARSLSRHGVNAGCSWDGASQEQMQCEFMPDKETPLWAPDLAPIYYWVAEEADEELGYFVSYNGWVNATVKSGGNPRHSYRCVRDALSGE
jgi:hypothetical protein